MRDYDRTFAYQLHVTTVKVTAGFRSHTSNKEIKLLLAIQAIKNDSSLDDEVIKNQYFILSALLSTPLISMPAYVVILYSARFFFLEMYL